MTLLRKAAFVLMVLAAPSTLANPTGGTVTSGAATIQQNGSTLQVTTSTQNTTINWQNFSIGAGETTNFTQPSSSSVVVNQVTTQNASQIFGSLTSNGQVFLINPNGVLFGPSSQVNTSGLMVDAGPGGLSFTGQVSGNVTLLSSTITTSSGGLVASTTTTSGTISAGNFTVGTVGGIIVTGGGGGSTGGIVTLSAPPSTGSATSPGVQGDRGGMQGGTLSTQPGAAVAVNLPKREPYY